MWKLQALPASEMPPLNILSDRYWKQGAKQIVSPGQQPGLSQTGNLLRVEFTTKVIGHLFQVERQRHFASVDGDIRTNVGKDPGRRVRGLLPITLSVAGNTSPKLKIAVPARKRSFQIQAHII